MSSVASLDDGLPRTRALSIALNDVSLMGSQLCTHVQPTQIEAEIAPQRPQGPVGSTQNASRVFQLAPGAVTGANGGILISLLDLSSNYRMAKCWLVLRML